MRQTFPADWRELPCSVVAIPIPLVPFVGGLLKLLEQRGLWQTDDDYINGYTATVELEACLMATCLTDLIEQQNALYRMVNTALFGVTYETTSTDPLVVIPAIAPHVTLDIHDIDSLLGRIDRLTQLVDNRIAGTETPLYDQLPGIKQQLEDLIAAVTASGDDSDLLAQLVEIVALLG